MCRENKSENRMKEEKEGERERDRDGGRETIVKGHFKVNRR